MSLKGGTVGSQARSQRHAWTCTEDGLEFRDLRELQLHMKRKVRPRRDVHSPRSRDGGEGGFFARERTFRARFGTRTSDASPNPVPAPPFVLRVTSPRSRLPPRTRRPTDGLVQHESGRLSRLGPPRQPRVSLHASRARCSRSSARATRVPVSSTDPHDPLLRAGGAKASFRSITARAARSECAPREPRGPARHCA